MILDDIKSFTNNSDSQLFFDYDLSKSNWFNIGGKTKIFFKPQTLQDLIALTIIVFEIFFLVFIELRIFISV